MENSKPRIFIGSSREGLPIAEKVKSKLMKSYHCVIWNDSSVFRENTSYLDSLLQSTSMFDFGILVASKDDELIKRDTQFKVPRDNILFEIGLFIGRLGRNRAFVLKQSGIDLPTDLSGIQMSGFDLNAKSEAYDNLDVVLDRFKVMLEEKYRMQELSLLPSTGIAIGFVDSFLLRLCNTLVDYPSVQIDGQVFTKFEVRVIIPKQLESDMVTKANIYYSDNGYTQKNFARTEKGRLVAFYSLERKDEGVLVIADMPTTLTALYRSIVLYLNVGHIGRSKRMELVEAKELENFVLTLKSLQRESSSLSRLVNIVRES